MKEIKMPHDLESEQGLISYIIGSPEYFVNIVDKLTASDFYSLTHQQVWTAMTELFKEGVELDIVSIRSQLKKQEINAGPVLEAIADAYEHPVFGANVSHFIEEIKNKSLLRQIIKTTTQQGYNAQLDTAIANDVLGEIEKDLLEIADRAVETKAVDSHGIVDDVQKDMDKAIEEGWQGYNTGFQKLDERTGGLIPTQSWIVGAYTGVGKTFFLLQIILNVLEQGGKVVLFSTEMDRKMNMLRMLGNLAGLGTINMMRGKMMENELEEYKKAQETLRKYKDQLTIYDNVYDIATIRLKSKKLKLTKGLDLIVVDFIQNLRGKESIYERMAEAAVSLQQMAQELDVTMLIGSQVSQNAAGWSSKEAIEFKGAGEIAAIADVALWILKDKQGDESLRKVYIRKIRHGSPAKFEVKLSFPSGRIVDMEVAGEAEVKEDNVKEQLEIG